MQFLPRFIYSVSVVAVDYEDETLCSSVVMSPQRADLVLSTDILLQQGHNQRGARTLLIYIAMLSGSIANAPKH